MEFLNTFVLDSLTNTSNRILDKVDTESIAYGNAARSTLQNHTVGVPQILLETWVD